MRGRRGRPRQLRPGECTSINLYSELMTFIVMLRKLQLCKYCVFSEEPAEKRAKVEGTQNGTGAGDQTQATGMDPYYGHWGQYAVSHVRVLGVQIYIGLKYSYALINRAGTMHYLLYQYVSRYLSDDTIRITIFHLVIRVK